jgi:hypothetical protein
VAQLWTFGCNAPQAVKTITNAPIRWGRSLLLGVLAVAALAVCSPAWMLAQMGGPVPFTAFWLLIATPFFLVALFLSKARSVLAGVVCGFSFAVPVAAFCWFFSTADPTVERYYRAEIRRDGVATLIFSVVLMLSIAVLRRMRYVERDKNSAEQGAAGNSHRAV